MATGLDPNDPRPAHWREYKPGSGQGSGASSSLPYLLCGNKIGGTETLDKISDLPLADEADAIARVGARSELYLEFRKLKKIDPDAVCRVLPVTESAGIAATFDATVANASTAAGAWAITILGDDYLVPVAVGDTANAVSTAINTAMASFDEGKLPVTTTVAAPVVTFTAANKGTRGDQILGSGASRGIRFRWIGPTNAQTITKGALTSGTLEDDYTAGIAELEAAVRKGFVYYLVTSKTATAAPSTTDNGIGELLAEVKRLKLPSVGLDLVVLFAMVGTNAQAVTVATHSSMNDWTTFALWAENNDWTTAMIAAHVAAQVRIRQIAYPADNLNGLATDIPKPYLNADIPTSTEVVTALNNGITPLAFEKGATRIVRLITNQSLNAQGNNDYRVREGHIPRVLHYGWATFLGMLQDEAQANADDDPPEGGIPPTKTTTPSSIVAVHDRFIDEMCSPAPFAGRFSGPLFKPSAKDAMKKNFVCKYLGGGAFNLTTDWKVVEHLIKTTTEIRETGVGYLYQDEAWFSEINPRRMP